MMGLKFKKVTKSNTKKLLEKHIFNEANLVSKTSTEATYKVNSEDFCKIFSQRRSDCQYRVDKNSPCKEKIVAPKECMELFGEQKIELIVSQPKKDAVSVKVTLNGSNAVLELLIDSKKINLKVHFKTLHKAMVAYSAANPKVSLPKEFPTSVEGILSLSLEYLGKLNLNVSIDEDIVAKGMAGKEKYSFSLSKQASLFSVDFKASNKQFYWKTNLHKMKASFAAKLYDKRESGLVELAINNLFAGTGTTSKKFTKTNTVSLGLEPSSLKVDGKMILKMSLKKFSLLLELQGKKVETIFAPGFDLQTFIDISSIESLRREYGKWTKGNSFRILLEGSRKKISGLTFAQSKKSMIKATFGTLKLENLTTKKKLTVLEGACLQLKEGTSFSGNSLIGMFASVACP